MAQSTNDYSYNTCGWIIETCYLLSIVWLVIGKATVYDIFDHIEYYLPFVILLVVNLLHALLFRDTFSYLRNIMSKRETVKSLSSVRSHAPTYEFKMDGYHKEQRVTVKKNKTTTRTVKVNTYSETFIVPIVSWRDISEPINIDNQTSEYVKLEMRNEVVFSRDGSDEEYHKLKNGFIETHRNRDKYYNFEERQNIEGFKGYILIKTRETADSYYIGPFYYLFAVLLGFGGFFENKLNEKCSKVSYTIRKLVSLKSDIRSDLSVDYFDPSRLNAESNANEENDLPGRDEVVENINDLPSYDEIRKQADNRSNVEGTFEYNHNASNNFSYGYSGEASVNANINQDNRTRFGPASMPPSK